MKIVHLAVLCFISSQILAQSLPVGLSPEELSHRSNQVLLGTDTINSLLVRPIRLNDDSLFCNPKDKSSYSEKVVIYPITLNSLYSSHHTFKVNTFPVIPSKGLQTHLSFGVFTRWNSLTLQVVPQVVQVFHPNYSGLPEDMAGVIWAGRYNWWNRIDEPETFGQKPFITIGWGQSSLRYDLKNISFGLSTENLYWGPGKHNSLIMSNNAYGFPNVTVNSILPSKTKVGNFEWKILWGLLRPSGQVPPDTGRVESKVRLYTPKYDYNRFVTGMILVYQPIFAKGLSLGYANVIQQYSNTLYWNDPFSALTSSFSYGEGEGDNVAKHQVSSFFFRWVFENAGGEVYMEYATQNPNRDFKNILEGTNQRAYTIGVSKGQPVGVKSFLQLEIEHTQLQRSPYLALDGKSFYVDSRIRHGYTHKGKVLGAQIGPGSNLQTINFSYLKEGFKIGAIYQRLAHNNDFFYFTFKDFRRFWIDRLVGLQGSVSLRKFTLTSQVSHIKSINYQWEHPASSALPYFSPGNDVINIQVFTQISYRL